jgi:NtrC-family two-component system response regulator AlgB
MTMAESPDEKTRILLIDDEQNILRTFRYCLEDAGHRVATATDAQQAEQLVQRDVYDLCFLDLRLGESSGLDLLPKLHQYAPWMKVVIVTAHSSIDSALDAMRAGAADYLVKPCSPEQLRMAATKQIQARRLEQRVEALEKEDCATSSAEMDSESPQMKKVLETLRQVADTDATVLILGESGTGKGVAARTIHHCSPRAKARFVTVNCPSLSAELLESELFGHKKGAFTGAVSDKVGLVELASGGSLLLDEIGEMAPQLQVKLLRLLQEREFRPIGSTRVVRADFRLICATNASLDPSTRKIREDLYFRINTITLDIPPLRDRPEDIPLLCEHFLTMFAKRHERDVRSIHPAAQEALLRHSWPGNVRELEHVVERAVIVAEGPEIVLNDLPDIMDQPALGQMPTADHAQLTLAEIERQAILQTLERTNGNKRAAASILGVYRPTLYGKLRKYKLGEYSATPKAKKTRAPEAGTPDEADRTEAQREAAEQRPRTPQGPPRP